MVIQAAIDKSGFDPQVKFESSDHGDVVLAGLTKLRNMEQLFDVVLIVENERFPAHKVVLASCSDYFRFVMNCYVKALTHLPDDKILDWST